MALDTFVAGRYTGAYGAVGSGVDVGVTEDGYELQQESNQDLINKSDAYGDSIIDTIYRGGQVYLQFEGKAYKAGTISPFWPFATIGSLGVVGRLGSAIATGMVLAKDSSLSIAPASLTATLALLAPNFPAKLLFSTRLRTVPIRLLILPADISGTIKWFALA